jgi:hypothetical protein
LISGRRRPSVLPARGSGRRRGVVKRRRIGAAVALIGIAALAAGAIEIASDSGGGSARTALDKATFIGRADAICAERYPEIAAYYRLALADADAGRAAAARSASHRVETAARRLIDGLGALGSPTDGAASVTTMLREYRQLFGDAIANTPASNAAAGVLRARIAASAARFGFRVCGRR